MHPTIAGGLHAWTVEAVKNTTHPGLTVIFCNDHYDLFAGHVQNRIKNNPTCFSLYPPRLVQQGFRDGGTPRKTIIRYNKVFKTAERLEKPLFVCIFYKFLCY
jgi:hypothetical protein